MCPPSHRRNGFSVANMSSGAALLFQTKPPLPPQHLCRPFWRTCAKKRSRQEPVQLTTGTFRRLVARSSPSAGPAPFELAALRLLFSIACRYKRFATQKPIWRIKRSQLSISCRPANCRGGCCRRDLVQCTRASLTIIVPRGKRLRFP